MICQIDDLHKSFSSAEDNPPAVVPDPERSYTREDAVAMSGLDCRTMEPIDQYAFMRCQIGKLHPVTTESMEGILVEECVFELIAFGATWNAALYMLNVKRGAIR